MGKQETPQKTSGFVLGVMVFLCSWGVITCERQQREKLRADRLDAQLRTDPRRGDLDHVELPNGDLVVGGEVYEWGRRPQHVAREEPALSQASNGERFVNGVSLGKPSVRAKKPTSLYGVPLHRPKK